MPDYNKLRELFKKRMEDGLSPGEEEELEELIGSYNDDELSEVLEEVFADVTDIDESYYKHDWEAVRRKIVGLHPAATNPPCPPIPLAPFERGKQGGDEKRSSARLRFFSQSFIRYVAAAVLLVALAGGVWYYFHSFPKATVVRGNASPSPKIPRSAQDDKEGVQSCGLVEPTQKEREKDNRLIHLSIHDGIETLSISPGWQFHTTLPDGSEVVLNAASSITYPGSFEGLAKREVEVKGEVFFDVAQKAHQPFFVRVKGVELQALGTSFNVNAYGDKDSVYTTLVSGSLRVLSRSLLSFRPKGEIPKNSDRSKVMGFTDVTSIDSGVRVGRANLATARDDKRPVGMTDAGVLLKPGQQAAISLKDTSSIKVNKANLAATGMWREGYFSFNQSRVDEVMQELGRWYKWDIRYAPAAKSTSFSGTFCRRTSEADVLETLKAGGIHFQKTGNTILIQ